MNLIQAAAVSVVNKRLILQPLLDKIEPGWIIKKPSQLNPCDVDYICIFQKPSEYKQVTVEISTKYFDKPDLVRIEKLLRDALKNAKASKPLEMRFRFLRS